MKDNLKNDLRLMTALHDNYCCMYKGKQYYIGNLHGDGTFLLRDENLKEIEFKDFEDAWENLQIDGEYLHEFAENVEWYNG